MLVLAGLATGNKIGIAAVAAVFISFALVSSFVAPKYRPEFPGRQGLSVFMLASFVLFAAMLTAIAVLAVEKETATEGAHAAAPAKPAIDVQETEFKIQLPANTELKRGGEYTFVVHNAGKIQHDLVFEGPNLAGKDRTSLIDPGGEAKLTVALSAGSYTLYCSVDGHRAAGMATKLVVG